MKTNLYKEVNKFLKKYPGTIAFRIKKHCEVIEKHIDKDEHIIYAFVGQKNPHWYDIISTHVFVLTNKRLMIATKRIVFGYFLYSITPEMFNDLTVYSGLIFGKITIDTVKELIYITNLSKDCLDEIETKISSFMIEEKKKYGLKESK